MTSRKPRRGANFCPECNRQIGKYSIHDPNFDLFFCSATCAFIYNSSFLRYKKAQRLEN